MTVFEMRARGIELAVDLSVGHIADLAITAAGRTLRPLHRAPWVDSGEALPGDLAPNVVRLSGDFFCAPFSRNDIEEAPTHGWPANSAWDVMDQEAFEAGSRARLRLRRTVMGATVEKLLTLRDGHPFLYQEHLFLGGDGSLPVAHHTMVRMAGGGRLAFSPKSAALAPEAAIAMETDPARGRSILAYPARTEDITRMPLADGGTTDLTRYPLDQGHEDFLTLVEVANSSLGFTAAARTAERDLVLVLKDPKVLPVTMLWYSNGGRFYEPWNGRHTGVLGVEDGISAVGHRQSLEDNAVRREGVPTALVLRPLGQVSVRQVIGAAGLDDVPQAVVSDVANGVLRLDFADGGRHSLPFDTGFLA